ncbi:tellurium resistance protein [Pseudoponticoccus marisrubri]|uniref:ADP-ribose pyrophosphatase n=1 Tax=Pseudoponticoccus marisrubri TaxID=1685382 RepID=A0A0W7WER4_9RHOB|nr:tellurium resistance protein [Pseudoponticoccus marisrubri]
MTDLFLYGTLRHVPLLERVLGRACPEAEPAQLPDHAVYRADGQPFPLICPEPGGRAEGLLLRGLDADAVDRLDFYEAGFGYDLQDVRVETADGPAAARVYMPRPGQWQAAEPWDLDGWVARWGAITLGAAEEVMARRGSAAAADMGHLLPFFRARAWSHEMARQPAPQTLRSTMTTEDVEILRPRPGFDGFFRIRATELRHRLFGGGWSEPMPRECFVAYDVSLVLPYDPRSDHVLLIEQVRFGPIHRGDPAPWVLEPVAGLIDAGETPEAAALREAREEADLEIDRLLPITRAYASPGYSTEFFNCFLGLCDLSGHDRGLGGLDTEHEDIRHHAIPFERAMELVESGEINAAPLVMMILWLATRREGLLASA